MQSCGGTREGGGLFSGGGGFVLKRKKFAVTLGGHDFVWEGGMGVGAVNSEITTTNPGLRGTPPKHGRPLLQKVGGFDED